MRHRMPPAGLSRADHAALPSLPGMPDPCAGVPVKPYLCPPFGSIIAGIRALAEY
jgi:hypothetical protein